MKASEVISAIKYELWKMKVDDCDILIDFFPADKVKGISEYDNGETERPIINIE